jgi:hypothetical protein
VRILRSGALVRLQLGPVEVQALADLLTELIDSLDADPAPGDAVHDRLYPAAYADRESEEGFREMTETSLRTDRITRAQECLAELVEAPSRSSGLARRVRQEIELSDAEADRWMRVLNDLRLVIGTRLGVTEEDETLDSLDPDDPQALSYVMYGWLTAMQDTLVRVLAD